MSILSAGMKPPRGIAHSAWSADYALIRPQVRHLDKLTSFIPGVMHKEECPSESADRRQVLPGSRPLLRDPAKS